MLLKSRLIVTAALTAVVATPIVAQDRDRPSRDCIREVVKLCGIGKGKINACLQTKFTELSQSCQDEVWDGMEKRLKERRSQNAQIYDRTAQLRPAESITFGEDERQQIEFYPAGEATSDPGYRRPLVLFIHGGGWSIGSRKAVQSKPTHFTQLGYNFASTGYRLMPDAPVEEQAKDVGAAIQTLRSQANQLGFDPNQIVVMGHSAGAHLAALVSTDPQYAGDAFGAIKGAILLDGAGYDIPAQLSGNQKVELPGLYRRVFGDDPARQEALSPIAHVGGPDAHDWLILHVADRPNSTQRSTDFGAALKGEGKNVRVVAIPDTDHGRMNREIGTDAGAQQTQAIDAFLSRVFN